jgi:hypothetical protein
MKFLLESKGQKSRFGIRLQYSLGVYVSKLTHLSTPAVSNDCLYMSATLQHRAVYDSAHPGGYSRIFLLNRIQNLWNTFCYLGRVCRALEESTQLLTFLLGIWRIPRDVRRLAIKEIWNNNLVWSLRVAMSKDISSLQSLRIETEDVKDDEDAVFGARLASHVFFVTMALVSKLCLETWPRRISRTYKSLNHQYRRICLWVRIPLPQWAEWSNLVRVR